MLNEKKLWKITEVSPEVIQSIREKTGVSELLAVILANRGYSDAEAIKKFLYPNISELHPPFLLRDMEKAAARIHEEIRNNGKILIYGDYDVDGITSTSILYDYLKNIGAQVEYYIPDRFEEGYGLNINALTNLCTNKPSLIITVDNGIAAVEEVRYINSLGIDVIITDHHECQDELPTAFAIINPKRPDCGYPFKFLAGVGVVFKLIQALSIVIGNNPDAAFKYLDLVCIGTIADIVPLVNENRVLVKYGLEAAANTGNPGVKALCKAAGVKEVNTWAIGYALSPRINAAGRLGEAARAVELFTAQDTVRANKIAEELNQENKNRQEIESRLVEQVLEKISNEQREQDSILVVHGENWHHGVIGIAAARITERFYKPCILISFEGDIGRGSGRSIEGFNLFDGLTQCSQLLEKYGGHELAGGLTIRREKIEEFQKEINKAAKCSIGQTQLLRVVNVDFGIAHEQLNMTSVSELKLLEPYGPGNPTPLFCLESLEIEGIRGVGDNKHLKLSLTGQGFKLEAIGFRMGDLQKELSTGDYIDTVFAAEINQYSGRKTIQLNIKDLRLSRQSFIDDMYYKTFHLTTESAYRLGDFANLNFGDREPDTIIGLINSEQSNIFLINTLQVSKQILGYLNNNHEKIKNRFEIFYNKPEYNSTTRHSGLSTVLIINPKIDEFDFSIFDNIILCDSFFTLSFYDTIRKKCLNKRLFILFDFEDIKYNAQILGEIIPERDHLAAIYKFLKSNYSGTQLDLDEIAFSRKVSKAFNLSINPFVLRKSLDIFQELNLIKRTSTGETWKVELLSTSDKKASLESSNSFTNLLKYRQEFERNISYLKQNGIFKSSVFINQNKGSVN